MKTHLTTLLTATAVMAGAISPVLAADGAAKQVTVDNFTRAETDRTMADYVKLGGAASSTTSASLLPSTSRRSFG